MPPYKLGSLCTRAALTCRALKAQTRDAWALNPTLMGKIKGVSNLFSRFREKKITHSCNSKVTPLSEWTDLLVFSHERATQGRLSSGKVSEGKRLSFHNLSRAQRGHPPQGLCWLSEPTGKVLMPCSNGHAASGDQTRHQESETRRKQSGHTPVTPGEATIITPSPGRSTLCSVGRPCLHSLYYSAARVGILNVNIFTVLGNFCWPASISRSTRSLQRCDTSRFIRYTCPSTNPVSISVRHLSPALGSSPSTSSICHNWPWALGITPLLRDHGTAFLISSASVTHSAVGSSRPPCQITPWSWITIAEQLQSYRLGQNYHIPSQAPTTNHLKRKILKQMNIWGDLVHIILSSKCEHHPLAVAACLCVSQEASLWWEKNLCAPPLLPLHSSFVWLWHKRKQHM